ncbi:MAG: hypothetical protein P4L90_29115 [Rhodopila sp.]|nr:hypothetical protein [Rhodopila sp.]
MLKVAAEAGLPLPTYRYVGMGAVRFYDFLLVHRYLGIDRMISLEHDKRMYRRAEFNAPFGFIKVKNQTSGDFIEQDSFSDLTVAWFDYDGGIGPHMLRDISAIALKMKLGDFFFVTVYGGPPSSLVKSSDVDRLAWFQDHLGDAAGEVTIENVENANFITAVHKVLIAAIKSAFAARRDGRFRFLLQVQYSDSVPMITVGGAFLADGQTLALNKNLARQLPFLAQGGEQLYEISSFHLTEQERALFDRAVTRTGRSRARNTLRKLGFRDAEIMAYRDLLRYVPRYVETIV